MVKLVIDQKRRVVEHRRGEKEGAAHTEEHR